MNNTDNYFKSGCLAVYKAGPAKVLRISDKIEIELAEGKSIQVREKDILFLHPGPVENLKSFDSILEDTENIAEACEILQGETPDIKEFSELVYDKFTPETAWNIYLHLLDRLYISGTISEISIRTIAEVQKETAARKIKADEKSEWKDFTLRVKKGSLLPKDSRFIKDLEIFALGKSGSSRLLKELKISETAENAHSLLLKLGYWDVAVNPYISRLGFTAQPDYLQLDISRDTIFSGERTDLTHLDSFAVDDEGNTDPDDAVSFDNGKLWIHIADPSAIISPGSDADIYAMNQGVNIYLPETRIPMLAHNATSFLGLGLAEESPALSVCVEQEEDGSIKNFKICFSRVKVKRVSYKQVEDMITENPFRQILEITKKYNNYRISAGAVTLEFPEVKIKVTDSRVSITPYVNYKSAEMVKEAMLMAGEAAARYAAEKAIPFPFSSQGGGRDAGTGDGARSTGDGADAASEGRDTGTAGGGARSTAGGGSTAGGSAAAHSPSLAGMFACRRQMMPGAVKSEPEPHHGLGLAAYSRITSPLRRYLDLAAHQQLRLSLEGKALLDKDGIISRIGAASAGASAVQKLEKLSNMHWTLVYLLQNPGWEGKGIVVDKRERFDTVIIPEISFEAAIPARNNRLTDAEINLRVTGVDLPNLRAGFTEF